MIISAMTPADLVDTLAHEDELFDSEAWDESSYRAELADRRYRHYLVVRTDDGALLGWGGVMVVAETAQILTIGVVTSAQRQGVGQTLLDALLDEARSRRASEVILEVRVDNGPARRLYERNGFTDLRVRKGYYDLGRMDALEMKKVLS